MKALAAYGAAIGASFALGPFIGGTLTDLFGWRAIFLVNVPIGVAVMWITYRRVAEGRDPTPRRIDLPGQMTLIGGLFLLVLALLRGNEDGWGSTGIIATLVGAAVLLTAFVVVEERSREPMLPLRLLAQRRFAGPQVAVFAIASSFFAVFLYLTLYLQTVLGPVANPDRAGLPSRHFPGLHRLGDDRAVRREVFADQDRQPGSGARRRRAGGNAGHRRRLLVDGTPARTPGDQPGHGSFQSDGERARPERPAG